MMKIYRYLLIKIKQKLDSRQFLFLLAVLAGLTAGLSAVILKMLVNFLRLFLYKFLDANSNNLVLLLLPPLGIIITFSLIKAFSNGEYKKGISSVLYAIAQKKSNIKKSAMFSHIVTSAVTIAFGGSAGLEAPIVVTGSAIGSNYGQANKLNYKERTLLLACGAAAGIAAVFNAPIAGVMFAIEVLLFEMSIPNFVLLIIAAFSGALCNKILLKESTLFFFSLKQPFNYYNVAFYFILGILTGFVSLYYTRMTHKIEHIFRKMGKRPWIRVISGGIVLGLLIYIFPPLFGEGYHSIKDLADGRAENILNNTGFSVFKNNAWFLIAFIGIIGLIKVFATAITLNAGGNGGNFAPSLFVGAFAGFVFSRIINLSGFFALPESNFTIVGMAGILSGVFYAPITAIFLIAEITGGYELMMPLMIVSSIAYLIVRHFEPYSMDTSKLASEGNIFTTNRDKNILMHISINDILETDFSPVLFDAQIDSLIEQISSSKRSIFPVLDYEGHLLGTIKLENIREILFDLESFSNLQIIELMNPAGCLVQITDSMNDVMQKFDSCGEWNLPVVDENKKYAGFISKSRIFSRYRDKLISFTG
jgi:CIC family chloride channel protein